MRPLWSKALRFRKIFRQLAAAALGLLLAAPAFAQGASPWENAVGVLQQAFTSTIARGLLLGAIVVSALDSASTHSLHFQGRCFAGVFVPSRFSFLVVDWSAGRTDDRDPFQAAYLSIRRANKKQNCPQATKKLF
jgi:hypothetical protein